MDSPRQQLCINLIQQLLTCTSWNEVDTILQANAELVDADFVHMMLTLSAQAQTAGDIGPAQFLGQLAIQIAEPLGLDLWEEVLQAEPTEDSAQDLTQFWLALLRAEVESDGNKAAVHQVMQQNLGLITPALGQIIALWTEQAIALWTEQAIEQQPKQAAEIARLVQHTCISIQEFPDGKYAEVLAIAIQGYEVVVALQANTPEERASTLNSLGGAVWTQAELGIDPVANLERAIVAYEESAQLSRQLGLDRNLSSTLNNQATARKTQAELGIDPAHNLERAITAYEESAQLSRQLGLDRDLSSTLMNQATARSTQAELGIDPAANLERAITAYEESAQLMRQLGLDRNLSSTLMNQANARSTQAQLGIDPALNLERAITAYEESAQLSRQLGLDRDLSSTLMNQATARSTQAELGIDPALNLERAITAYEESAQLSRQLGLDRDLSKTLMGQATARSAQAELGIDPARNLERAIIAYEESAQLMRQLGLDRNLSSTLMGQANARRIQAQLGIDPARNLERAITDYEESAQLSRQLGLDRDLSKTLMSQATARLIQAELGIDPALNLERAITAYEESAQLSRQLGLDRDLSRTLINQATARQTQAELGIDPALNLERAIVAYEESAQLSRQLGLDRDLSSTLMNQATARGTQAELGIDPAANLERAITDYEESAQLSRQLGLDRNLSSTLINQANARRIQAQLGIDPAANLERAITDYEESAQLSRQLGLDRDLSKTLMNQANARRIQAQLGIDPAANLERAITDYEESAQLSRQLGLTRHLAKTLSNFGFIYQAQAHLTGNPPTQTQTETVLANAYDQFQAALAQVESLRGEIGADSEGYKRNFNEEWNRVYQGMVGVCLELGLETEAMAYADRSKARNLTELIATREIYPGGVVPEDERQALHQLKQQIAQEERRLQDDPNPDPTQLNQWRQQKQALEPYQPLSFDNMQALLDEDTAILEWYLLPNQFLTFTLTAQSLELRPSSEQDRQKLIDWANAYLDDYDTDKDHWRDQPQLTQRLAELSQILHLDGILAKLQEIHPTCQKLILIPHLFLHLFPLHALPTANESEDGGQFLQDRFSQGVVYAPNCQVLQQAQIRRQQHQDFDRLFAIQNPTQDLQFTDLEVETIQTRFDLEHVHVYKHGQADKATIVRPNLANPTYLNTQAELQAAHCAHFSCHGYFNFENALKSALILANSEFIPPPPSDDRRRYLSLKNNKLLDLQQCLTLEDILRLDLHHCRLVTLSACETGLTDFTSTSDEYIGLPSGFILAGASNVVSTLWTVNDLSTALFMIHFYQLVQPGQAIPLALRRTQRWLRESTVETFKIWSANISEPLKQAVDQHFECYDPGETPFVSPYYWAAFCVIGA
ncbi:MAG: CHAT domain-containing protein [Leptolyngbya sp. SIO1E4]|nr:CHAT domain-containing protein [Leptolyngbya sp. SIO1E4]